ncbi:hypothetical protein QBC37DRAFT_406350 [Rhypophila decipiens]|uniref:Uncharacterized protein n=1 Tax=Rhypophila decipiens TaxID=261697 RepID=A0AAN7B2A1_9PEZI|nr:hypothetical protein QBC37DRAFT_406350 [Rhypophila decipiens]
MRPATVGDPNSEKSNLTTCLHLLDLTRVGENFLSHLIATTGSRGIRAHGPKGLGLPLELWHMIIQLLKQDSNLNSGEYCFVKASPYPASENKNGDKNATKESDAPSTISSRPQPGTASLRAGRNGQNTNMGV